MVKSMLIFKEIDSGVHPCIYYGCPFKTYEKWVGGIRYNEFKNLL